MSSNTLVGTSFELIKGSLHFSQLLVGTSFNNLSIIKDQNFISILDCGDSMCNDNRGLSSHNLIKGFLDSFFVFSIKSTSGFIQNQNRGVLENSSGNSNSLLLTTGKLTTLRADFSLETSTEFSSISSISI